MMRPIYPVLVAVVAMAQTGEPPVVDPGASNKAPSDAVILFDGLNAGEWQHRDGRPPEWHIRDSLLVCKSGSGDLVSKRGFGSAQIHLEFSTPDMPGHSGQAKGNSGVYLQGRYEIQILDSYRNPTYPNGSAAAVYGQFAPLVNVSRPPGEWQSFDMIFRAPRCGADGQVRQPATLTLLHNGVLVHDQIRIRPTPGGTGNVCEPGPLLLQDHFDPNVGDTPVRFRNIWVRALPEAEEGPPLRDRRLPPR